MNKVRIFYQKSCQHSITRTLGVNQIVKEREMNNQEKYKILLTSNGSFLQANLVPSETIICRVASIVASFGPISTQIRTLQTLGQSIQRKLAGGSFYLEEFTAEKPTTLLVASKDSGDVAVIELDTTRDFIFRSESLLACTSSIKLGVSPSGFGMGDGGFFFGVASGKGIVAFSKPGAGLISIVLESEEIINLNPRNVVAWDNSMSYFPIQTDAIPASRRVIWKNLEWMTQRGIPFRHAAETSLFFFHERLSSIVHLWRYWVIGERGLYCFKGPGELLISTTRSK